MFHHKKSFDVIALALSALVLCLVTLSPATAAAQPVRALPPGDDARVTRVVSGDTIEVVIKGIGFTIGYLGLDAPDPATAKTKAECYAAQSLTYNRKLVAGMTVRVEREVSDFDATGRLLRYVYLPDGRMVNELLARAGYARAVASTPDRRYQERLNAAQQSAQTAKLGLWGMCAPKATPAPAVAVPASGPCVLVDYQTLALKGPRPAALNALPVGACVNILLQGQTGTFTWYPAGSRLRLDRSMYVRWQDALVPIQLNPDGKLLAFTCIQGVSIASDGRRYPGRDWADREVERGGAQGDIVMLPINRTFVFQAAGNGEFVALVDTLQWASGPFIRKEPDWHDRIGNC